MKANSELLYLNYFLKDLEVVIGLQAPLLALYLEKVALALMLILVLVKPLLNKGSNGDLAKVEVKGNSGGQIQKRLQHAAHGGRRKRPKCGRRFSHDADRSAKMDGGQGRGEAEGGVRRAEGGGRNE